MKTIYLVRHAQAVPVKEKLPDARRPLTKKGQKSAASMAKKMKKSGLKADHWISSTADRAVETAHVFAEVMGRSIHKIQLKDAVYSAYRPESLAEIIKGLKNKHQSTIIFGHNPMLSDLAAYFVKDFQDSLPKTGMVVIEYDVEKWVEISEGTGRLTWVDHPKRDLKLADRMRKDLENHIQIELTGVLTKLDEPAAVKSRKLITTVSKTLADNFIKDIRKQRIKDKEKMRLIETPDTSPARKKRPVKPTQIPGPPPAVATPPRKSIPGPDSPVKKKPASQTKIKTPPKPEAKAAEKKATPKLPAKPRPKTRRAVKKSPQKKVAEQPAASAAKTTVKRRKPGRPKKASSVPAVKEKPAVDKALVTPTVTSKPAAPVPPKRRPGRPRKSPIDKGTQAAAGQAGARKPTAVRKPGGRRKKAQAAAAKKTPVKPAAGPSKAAADNKTKIRS